MTLKEEKIIYFYEKGLDNTDRVLELVKEKAEKSGIKSIIVATTKGETGVKAANIIKDKNLIVITHSTGFYTTNLQELTDENRKNIEDGGGVVFTGIHAFGGMGRAIRKKFNTYISEEIVANTLRIFGEGLKVAVEITLMACDAGLIDSD
ncbi:MAG: hypothetical protein KAS39_04295, partial [Actinomycetia bacterium]|nr:hypothetical protein [Actinomycetes bacterium]